MPYNLCRMLLARSQVGVKARGVVATPTSCACKYLREREDVKTAMGAGTAC